MLYTKKQLTMILSSRGIAVDFKMPTQRLHTYAQVDPYGIDSFVVMWTDKVSDTKERLYNVGDFRQDAAGQIISPAFFRWSELMR